MEPHSTQTLNTRKRRISTAPAIGVAVPPAPARSGPAAFAIAVVLAVFILLLLAVCGVFADPTEPQSATASASVVANHPIANLPAWTPAAACAGVVVLILLNGAFSMAETALVSVRSSRVEQLVEEGRRGATAVRRLIDSPPRLFATTQTGITLLGFAAAAAAATTLAPSLSMPLMRGLHIDPATAYWSSVVLITLALALVAMIFGEIAPKSVALQAPDIWALRLAPFVNLCSLLFAPITLVVIAISSILVRPFGAKAQFETPMITREEFEKIIDQGEKHGELDDAEAKIITNVFDLSETPVRSVMTARRDMTTSAIEAALSDLLDTILQSGHSRIPVYEGTIDNIVGIVHAKDLLPLFRSGKTDMPLRSVMRVPWFVPESRRVADLLTEMRRSNQQLAIVQDEYAGTEGLVTIEDLLEEIVGDIRDEYDVDEPDIMVISETESLVDGRMGIDDVNERLQLELPHTDYDTIGGLVFGEIGHEPVPGEQAEIAGMTFVVESVEGRRIKQLRAIRPMKMAPEESEEEGTAVA